MSTKDIRNIAVIGAGLMGHSIAQEFAVSGYRVSLNDVSEERLDHARERIRQNLEMLGRSDEWDGVASRITFTGDLRTAVEGADLVIEAITENLDIKRELFAELESICGSDTILASNTSTYMPSQLAEATQNPERVIVMHYFNPPHVVPLVEVVGGRDTSPDTVETVRDLLVSQGKKPVVLEKEALGFIGNRLQAALLRECFALVENGVVRPEDIDTVVTTSFGRRLGVAGAVRGVRRRGRGRLVRDLRTGDAGPRVVHGGASRDCADGRERKLRPEDRAVASTSGRRNRPSNCDGESRARSEKLGAGTMASSRAPGGRHHRESGGG